MECTPLFGEKPHMWAISAPVLRFLHWAIERSCPLHSCQIKVQSRLRSQCSLMQTIAMSHDQQS